MNWIDTGGSHTHNIIISTVQTRVNHDSSVGEWTYLTVCFLHGPGSIPVAVIEYFKGLSQAD